MKNALSRFKWWIITVFLFAAHTSQAGYNETEIHPKIQQSIDEIMALAQNEPKKAISLFNAILRDADLSHDEEGELYYQKGWISYKILQQYADAIVSFHHALTAFRESEHQDRQYDALTFLGLSNAKLFNYSTALSHFK